jgi:hypothetical protein
MPQPPEPDNRETSKDMEALGKVRMRKVAGPADARALSTFSRIDYEDAFFVDVGPPEQRTAVQWARAVLEDALSGLRRALQGGWLAIGLKIGRKWSERLVLGWEVRRRSPDFVLLGAESRVWMAAEPLFRRDPDGLLFAAFVQQGNPLARALWAGVETVHVPVVRQVLERASRRSRVRERAE